MKELITLAKTLNILAGKEIAVIQNGILAVENGNIKITCQRKDIYHVTILENGKVKKGIAAAEIKHLLLAIAQYCNFDVRIKHKDIEVLEAFAETSLSEMKSYSFYLEPQKVSVFHECEETELCVLDDNELPKFSEFVLFKHLSNLCEKYGIEKPKFMKHNLFISHESASTIISTNRETGLFVLRNECDHKKNLVLNLEQVLSIFEASYQNEFK